jgi:hypothetical protein
MVSRHSFLTTWLASVGCLLLLGCSGERAAGGCDARGAARCGPAAQPVVSLGLRVGLSSSAKSVCVTDAGCPEGPKGTLQIRPLQPQIRAAIAEALVSVGLEVVELEATRDMVADVEWRGTDTIALRLQDQHGRLVEQASFSRSLGRCQDLPQLTWDTCWAANLPQMKSDLARPLQRSQPLLAFAQKNAGVLVAAPNAGGSASGKPPAPTPVDPSALAERLDGQQIQATVARYREEIQRVCFQPARDAREPTAPTSARVATQVTIDPSGRVASVTTSGDPPGYSRLAPCIEAQLRQWRFPPAKGPTSANIPFVFTGE